MKPSEASSAGAGHISGSTPGDLREIARHLATFRQPSTLRGLFELSVSVLPLTLLWLVMWLSLHIHYVMTLLLAFLAAGFVLRLFLIQHDCGHGAFFRSRGANDWVGRCIGVLTLSPYSLWRRGHATHHAGTGNLDRRGTGDVDTLTVCEFRELGLWGQLRYRLYRNPAVMFGLGPAWLFFLRYRLPLGHMREGWRPWASAMGTNCAIAFVLTGLILLVGLRAFLLIQLPITLIAASAGVWLFYVQHQFEQTHWSKGKDWAFHEAALLGSSHYALPGVLRWFTANIGMHHIHHLCSNIPFYRLSAALEARPELADINRLTIRQSLRSVRLVLWDEANGRLISFREARMCEGCLGCPGRGIARSPRIDPMLTIARPPRSPNDGEYGAVEGTEMVDVDDPAMIRDRNLFERAVGPDAGIVDPAGEPAERLLGSLGDPLSRPQVARVRHAPRNAGALLRKAAREVPASPVSLRATNAGSPPESAHVLPSRM